MNVVEDFANALKSLETRQDILAQWNQMDARFKAMSVSLLNDEIKAGSAQRLARQLHQQLFVRPLGDRSNHMNQPSVGQDTKTLYVMVLCHLVGTLLRLSTLPRHEWGVSFGDDITAALPRVVHLILAGSLTHSKVAAEKHGDETVSTLRSSTLSQCIHSMERLWVDNADASCTKQTSSYPASNIKQTSYSPAANIPFLDALLALLCINTSRSSDSAVPFEVAAQAACCLARMIGAETCSSCRNEAIYLRIWDTREVMLSVLTCAALTNGLKANALVALGQLARYSNGDNHVSFGAIMVQRASLMRAIHQCLDGFLVHRKHALELTRLLIPYLEGGWEQGPHSLDVSLVMAVGNAALKETNPGLKLRMANVLSDLLAVQCLDFKHFQEGLSTLYSLATLHCSGELSTRSSILYLQSAKECTVRRNSFEALPGIIHFSISPCPTVRTESLQVLKHILFWKPESIQHLLASTDLLDCLSRVLVSIGSDADCCLVAETCQQMLFDKDNHTAFCTHDGMLSALVGLVTTEPILHSRAYSIAVRVVLDLLTDENFVSFLSLASSLLPWLIKLANRTTDEDMKSRLVAAIVGFTSVLLLEC